MPPRLIHGDCLKAIAALPDASIDAVITDPPYASGGLTAGARSATPNQKYIQSGTILQRPDFPGDTLDQRSWYRWCLEWAGECERVLRPGGYFLAFTDWRQLPTTTDYLQAANLIWRGVIAWDKGPGARAPHKGYFRHQCEYIAWGTKGALPKAVHGGPWAGCFGESVKQSDKHHVTGKPTPLMRELVRIVPPGGVILDPFMGSGTTGVAAVMEGREFIGVERTTAYFVMAKKRIRAARAGS